MNGKVLWSCFWLGLGFWGVGQAEEAEPIRVQVALQNGNRFSGELLPATQDHLLLKPYWLASPLRLEPGDLYRYQKLNSLPADEDPQYRIQFHSGNYFSVKSVRTDGDAFEMEGVWDGDVRVPRSSLKGIEFLDATGLLYYGPRVLLPGQDAETHRKLLMNQAGMQWQTEKIQFPKKFQLEIEMEPAAENYVYHISLFDWQTRAWGSVVFQVTPDQISAAWYQRRNQNRMSVKNWRQPIKEMTGPQQFRFFVNLEKNEMTLWLNGDEIHTWTEPETESLRSEMPFNIGFRYLSGTGAIKISSIRLMPWSGELPSKNADTSKDHLVFKTGEQLAGSFQAMDRSHVTFLAEGEGKGLLFSLDKILQLSLSSEGVWRESGPPATSAQVYLQGGGDPLQVAVDSLNGGGLTGRVWTGATPFSLSVPLSAVQRLEFPETKKP